MTSEGKAIQKICKVRNFKVLLLKLKTQLPKRLFDISFKFSLLGEKTSFTPHLFYSRRILWTRFNSFENRVKKGGKSHYENFTKVFFPQFITYSNSFALIPRNSVWHLENRSKSHPQIDLWWENFINFQEEKTKGSKHSEMNRKQNDNIFGKIFSSNFFF